MSTSPADGIVVVDKPAGCTSHDVVARLRRIAGTRKVGHAGTLDPMATGVLVVGMGRATRLLGHLMLTEKAYDATVRLGVATSTDDAAGEILTETPTDGLAEEQVRAAVAGFVGEIDQVPSAVSAVKVGGRRAYDRVRAGETVELAARQVTVHELRVLDLRRESDRVEVDLSVRCSSGTYVRAIARDLGAALGVGGHLTALRRTAVGTFGLDEARTLDELADRFDVIALADVARRCFPSQVVDVARAQDVGHGRRLNIDLPAAGPVALLDEAGDFLALYEQRGPVAAAVAVFPR